MSEQKPMTLGEHINLRISSLNHSLEVLTYNEPDIDVYHWAQGRKEQINWELEFLGELTEVLQHTLIIS